ncbi:NAD(P)H-binding protein [Winogradskyella sediminis]|uniref:Nucleoside-diphosphate-sugar epimerase n=1 Tax=Winogradskyella sediminis TaxID=1382466 RepID=A0A1H1SRX4_9FLAO|nr:NAD(P)H-binding protein [Winogradskyella sediminis]SDS50675.1 Nucleoside-diphosphate-sugar epimerase [Winogradskyella sediminis]
MNTQISIIGCGWLGFPLAQQLIKEGYTTNGSTTSTDKLSVLKSNGIQPFLVTLSETTISGDYSKFLTGSNIVIINIPPGLRKQPNKNHVAEIKHLMHAIEHHNIKQVLYISSTSVYKDNFHYPIISANTVPNATSKSGKQLIAIEQMLSTNPNFKTTILRFGGLVDKDRHPSKFLSGKTNIPNPEAPINLIHKTDCIAIISTILKNELWNVTLNAAYPIHPSKKTYYIDYCQHHNLPLPEFNSVTKSKGKLIDSSLLVQLLKYTFKEIP